MCDAVQARAQTVTLKTNSEARDTDSKIISAIMLGITVYTYIQLKEEVMSTADNSTHFTVATQSKDAKNTSMVMWLASVFLGVFAGLIFGFMVQMFVYKHSSNLQHFLNNVIITM